MELARGRVEANGLDVGYLEAGPPDGPLALCLHGFPDSAWTWRHLLPRLADAGFHAVAPFLRGYAPTSVPADGIYQTGALSADALALHEVLGGTGDAVLIGHDWGAMAVYGAAAHEPQRWRRVVTAAVPPVGAVAGALFSYPQLKRSFYMWFFQLPMAETFVGADDLAFIAGLWGDWTGSDYDTTEDVARVKECLRAPENLSAALGYYRAMLGNGPTDPRYDSIQAAGAGILEQPTLYIHGRADAALGVELAQASEKFLNDESKMVLVDGGNHFVHLERPDEVDEMIVAWVTE
jgi:pimeloyl-ACP methyl ester carboxylesterase